MPDGRAVVEVDQDNRPLRLLSTGVQIFEAAVEGDIEQGRDSFRASARLPRHLHWRHRSRKANIFRPLQCLEQRPAGTDGDSAGHKSQKPDDDEEPGECLQPMLPRKPPLNKYAVCGIIHRIVCGIAVSD